MAFRSREMMKKILKKVGGEQNLAPGVKEAAEKIGGRIPKSTKRNWKPNVQEKRLFSYILDRQVRVKVTTHALRCIDKAGGLDEYLLKTPYHKMDTEMGLFWKTKIEKMYKDLGEMEVVFFSPEDETNIEKQFKELKLEKKAARREARRKMYGSSGFKEETAEDGGEFGEGGEDEGSRTDFHEPMVANA
ncbi:50S ribosomal protein l28 [Phtheirospermum japonicum]|uniref:Large ribosomal subunit protein bL28m n=1 Tax=Phtheirospermum japonicum TaxID=374723 RepID=A0A830BDX2_9LAMI|nr:50S ribosomal protein l28 [Phtheirospermum japonicum]